MTQYADLLRTLSPNHRKLREVFEALQTDLREAQTIDDLFYGPYYDDLRVPFTQTKRGANLKPDFDETSVGYLFPQNDATEQLYFVAQLPHSWRLGSALLPHIHWQQEAATAVTWKIDVKLVLRNNPVPAEFVTYSAATESFNYTEGALSQISRFPDLDMSAVTVTSGLLIGKVYRDDNTTTGDVLAWELDFHFESDSPGSRTEFIK